MNAVQKHSSFYHEILNFFPSVTDEKIKESETEVNGMLHPCNTCLVEVQRWYLSRHVNSQDTDSAISNKHPPLSTFIDATSLKRRFQFLMDFQNEASNQRQERCFSSKVSLVKRSKVRIKILLFLKIPDSRELRRNVSENEQSMNPV